MSLITTDRDYQSQCSHEHRTYCDKCDDLTKTIDDITAAIEALAADEVKEELRFVMGKAKQDIVSWKAHILRSVNQEEANILCLYFTFYACVLHFIL